MAKIAELAAKDAEAGKRPLCGLTMDQDAAARGFVGVRPIQSGITDEFDGGRDAINAARQHTIIIPGGKDHPDDAPESP